MSTPAFVMKNCSIAAGDAGNRVGQCTTITVPVPEKSVEEFRNAGMIKPREVTMGYAVTTASFTETAFDPAALALFGVGANTDLIAFGYMQDETTGLEHSARFEMVCDVKRIDAGEWEPAAKGSTTYEVTVHSGVLYIDDAEILRFDDFDFSVGGVSQNPGLRAALGLN